MEVRDTRSGHDGLVLGSSSDVREYHPLSLLDQRRTGVRRTFDRTIDQTFRPLLEFIPGHSVGW